MIEAGVPQGAASDVISR